LSENIDKILKEFYDGETGGSDGPERPEAARQPDAAPRPAGEAEFPVERIPIEQSPPEQPPAEAETKPQKQSFLGEAYDWLQVVVVAIVGIVLVFVFLARTIEVVGPSMQQTLHDKDRIVLSDLFYTPKYGDIVVLRRASFEDGTPIIKRVIATAGQTVDIDFDAGIVSVDGVPLNEPYTADLTHLQENFSGPITVPAGCIFVMGDNRNNSTDSRDRRISMVDTREIMGRLLFRLFPISQFGAVNGPKS